MLPRTLHLPAAGPDTAQWCAASYVDGRLTRREILRTSGASDTYLDWQVRTSPDNGRSWTAPTPLPGVVDQRPEGGVVTFPGSAFWEPTLGILYEIRMRRLWAGLPAFTFEWKDHNHPFTDHTFIAENGQERLLRYEDGDDYDPWDPFRPTFDGANRAYHGVGLAFDDEGTAWFPLVCMPGRRRHTEGGVVLMRRDPDSGAWTPSEPRFIDPALSSRGLQEPDVAHLADGRLLVVMRGSNTDACPGRKWFTTSDDGGRTLAPVEAFGYDDGQSFYSPSSIHSFVRSTRNGRLYWIANICDEPPSGNGPRYPLYIAEIDEQKVAVRRDSLVQVDTRRDGDSDRLQLSNFSVIENRASHEIEIYLTRIGEDPDHFWRGPVFRYTFTPPAP